MIINSWKANSASECFPPSNKLKLGFGKIAVIVLKKNPKASSAEVKLAYAIGKAAPVMATCLLDRKPVQFPAGFDLTPTGIKKLLKLDKPIYKKTASWGHFGNNFIWDK